MCKLRKKSSSEAIAYVYEGYVINAYPSKKAIELYDGHNLIVRFRIETISRRNSAYVALVRAMIDNYIQIYEEGKNDSGT